MTFGEFFRSKRIGLRIPLRQFCIDHKFDSVVISKLERGRLQAPSDEAILSHYAKCLKLDIDNTKTFMDLAMASEEPKPLTDEELVKKFPHPAFINIDVDPDSTRKRRDFVEIIRNS